MATATRIYHVFLKTPVFVLDVADKAVSDFQSRLVRAASQAQALGHVARNTLAVSKPTQDELIDLAGNGVKVEDAVEEQT